MRKVWILGIGRLGGALAIALPKCGVRVTGLVTRGRSAAGIADSIGHDVRAVDFDALDVVDADVLVICVQDSLIAQTASAIEKKVRPGTVVLHTSGSMSSDVLLPLREAGCSVGSMHPLISFSDPQTGSQLFAGGRFCLEGESAALEAASEMVQALGGMQFTVPTDKKALYHSAAVMACGHLVSLLDVSFEMLRDCGLSEKSAAEAVMPLVVSTLGNLADRTPSSALTGPFARADVETVERGLGAVRASGVEGAFDLFVLLGERSLQLAAEAGADPARIAEIREALRMAKSQRAMLDS